MKAILYANNSTAQTTVATGTTINFGNVVRRYGCDCNLDGGNAVIGCGYYEADVNITFIGGAIGTEVIQIYKNGVAIPGAVASASATDGGIESITIPFVVRNTCNCTPATLTVVASGVEGSVSNASIVIERC